MNSSAACGRHAGTGPPSPTAPTYVRDLRPVTKASPAMHIIFLRIGGKTNMRQETLRTRSRLHHRTGRKRSPCGQRKRGPANASARDSVPHGRRATESPPDPCGPRYYANRPYKGRRAGCHAGAHRHSLSLGPPVSQPVPEQLPKRRLLSLSGAL